MTSVDDTEMTKNMTFVSTFNEGGRGIINVKSDSALVLTVFVENGKKLNPVVNEEQEKYDFWHNKGYYRNTALFVKTVLEKY